MASQNMQLKRIIDFDEGWGIVLRGITKLKKFLEDEAGEPFCTEDEYMTLYTTIYKMCTQEPPYEYSSQLYNKYKETIEDYLASTVLPPLIEKHDELMLREFAKRWSNHKIMVRWLKSFFCYLGRYFITRRSLPSLKVVGLTCFRQLVYKELMSKVRDAAIALIDREREGEEVDKTLLKNIVDIFVEIGLGSMEYYEDDFEAYLLVDTDVYYSRKFSNWIQEDSLSNYMIKAEECLKQERERVSNYLHCSTEKKSLEKVQNQLLLVTASQILEKEQFGCHALLRVDDLSRMYRLFSRLPHGLEPVSKIFEQHVTAEGIALVKQAEDATSNDEVFARKVIELHDRYLAFVNDCFHNDSLFHKALKEAFVIFCNKSVAGSSSAELLATFCDNLLQKGCCEMNDKDIEETLEKKKTSSKTGV